MQATNLKTNHLTQPLGIDAGTLFLSWQCAEGVRQTAYEIEVTAGAETLWASGKALGSVMHTETPIAGKGQAQPYQPHRPASYLRKTFTAPAGQCKRLYITAKGLYAAWLNGKRVGDMVLAPGSFTADKHLGAQTYNVTALVRDGENELLIALGDGW